MLKVAGCTLDASAKIYAGRVDSIYNDACKMVGGLGRSDRHGKEIEHYLKYDTCMCMCMCMYMYVHLQERPKRRKAKRERLELLRKRRQEE